MKKVLLLITVLLVTGCESQFGQKLQNATGQYIYDDQLLDLIENNQNYVLIDLRPTTQYFNFHIPTSINIPYHDIENILDTGYYLFTIVIYSQDRVKQKAIYKQLLEWGYTDVLMLYNGISGWSYEFEKGSE